MSPTTFAATAAAADGISIRTMMLLLASIVAAVIGGWLGYLVSNGTHNQKLAAGVIAGFIAFVGTYKFLDSLVLNKGTEPVARASPTTSPLKPWPSHSLTLDSRESQLVSRSPK